MRATNVRTSPLCLWGLVLMVSLAGRASAAGEADGWPGPGEVTYVSKGLNFDHNWGTFVLHRGDGGRALYTKKGEPIREVRVQFVAVFPSSTDPNVLFAVYRETAANPATTKVRQWAFQIDFRTPNGYVIYIKDNETSVSEPGWQIYDFAENHPGW
jgi:hypothetical protein